LQKARGKQAAKELADVAGVSEPLYMEFECGKRSDPTLSKAYRVAAALGVPLDLLVHEKTQP
jgi:transcriptional regulator with XRE-family HTH domain